MEGKSLENNPQSGTARSTNPYHGFVSELAALYHRAKRFPLGGVAHPPRPALRPDAPKALIFSPHPDDEAVIGALPLRLLRESQLNVINVAVTQGSNRSRQAARWEELEHCCHHLGFGLIQTQPNGLERINPEARKNQHDHWSACVERIAQILSREQPRVVFFPHDADWNSTHLGTHHLLMDALARLGGALQCLTVETEFWGAMNTPNLMVESGAEDTADLITALTFHEGEVSRNAYHLRLPGWLIDNVRRGGELVGGQGASAPDFLFATLYRVRRWTGHRLELAFEGGRFLSRSETPSTILGALPPVAG